MANPHQNFCLENPMDRGAWWATVHGVAESDMNEYDAWRAQPMSSFCISWLDQVTVVYDPIAFWVSFSLSIPRLLWKQPGYVCLSLDGSLLVTWESTYWSRVVSHMFAEQNLARVHLFQSVRCVHSYIIWQPSPSYLESEAIKIPVGCHWITFMIWRMKGELDKG